ncbi:MAG: hypothetical protein IPH09_03450 [bacterium]|nr:hypothetical protein [bacterium]
MYGCFGLPVLWEMGVGETIMVEYDPYEDAVPDPLGWYRVELTGTSTDPGSDPPLRLPAAGGRARGATPGGAVKALYH